jgi:hypothetical protein
MAENRLIVVEGASVDPTDVEEFIAAEISA